MQIRLSSLTAWVFLGLAPSYVLGTNVLKTDGYQLCSTSSAVQVHDFSLAYDRTTQQLTFNVAGTNDKAQKVTADVSVSAYGNQVYQNSFDPCANGTTIPQLCPLPAGNFAANGSQTLPSQYADMIPSIAFSVPNLEGEAKLELKAQGTGDDVACIQSAVTNGQSLQIPAVSYVAVGIAGAALALSGLSAISSAGQPGSSSSSPGFGQVLGWFQSMATNGMLSVPYPQVYRSFASNFGFSTGLISWGQMQGSIDHFRQLTGGNLTTDSYQFLQNATLVYNDGSANSSSAAKRSLGDLLARSFLALRDLTASVNGTGNSSATGNTSGGGIPNVVQGIQAYSEQLTIPQSNTFMTVLLFFALVIAVIAVGILLLKVILEAWALYGSFPASLTEFRKHYWGLLARTVTNLILIVYGIWVLYCVYQFTRGDSWAAKLLAGLTLAVFTAILIGFTLRIAQLARRFKKSEGDASVLYEDKKVWRRYSLFYDSYKRDYWWIFVPAIVYMFAKGCIIAGGDGHGLVQTAGQLIVESLMLILLLWSRPYVAKSSQWINITIQAVRVVSVVCILIFVQELGLSQTTKTITGVVLIAVQSTLTGILAILIAVNALIICIRQNPHAKLRAHNEKMKYDMDNLTALDARNSLLIDGPSSRAELHETSKYNLAGPYEPYRDKAPLTHGRAHSTDRLISTDTFYRGHQHAPSTSRDRSPSPEDYHEPPRSFGVAY